MNLGETIYRLRSERNMSQSDLADALDVSRQSVSKWENNSAVPELEKLIKISELFHVTLDELVGRENHTPLPVETSAPQQPSSRRTLGAIFLCFGLLTALLLSLLGVFIIGIFVGFPLTLIGCVLLSNKEPILYSAWAIFAIYAPLGYYFMLNFIGYGVYLRYIFIGVWFAALILWAIVLNRKGKLTAQSRKFIRNCLIISLALLLLLGAVNTIAYRRSGLMSSNEALDVSYTQGE